MQLDLVSQLQFKLAMHAGIPATQAVEPPAPGTS